MTAGLRPQHVTTHFLKASLIDVDDADRRRGSAFQWVSLGSAALQTELSGATERHMHAGFHSNRLNRFHK